MGHAIRTWFVVCSKVPHSQFDEGTRLHLHGQMESPTPVHRQLSLTQKVHSNRPGTDPRYENIEPGSILTVLCIPYV